MMKKFKIMVLICALSFVSISYAQESARSVSVNGEFSATNNEAGGKDWKSTRNIETQSVKTATMQAQGTSQKDENGNVSWQRTSEGQTRNGKSLATTTTGDSQKTDTGREWNTTTQINGQDGKSATVTRTGTATKNENGGIDVTKTKEVVGKDGKKYTVETNGTATKDDSGYHWQGTTETTGPNGKTSEVQRQVDRTKSADGTIQTTGSVQGTTSNGKTWQSQGQGTPSKTKMAVTIGRVKKRPQPVREEAGPGKRTDLPRRIPTVLHNGKGMSIGKRETTVLMRKAQHTRDI